MDGDAREEEEERRKCQGRNFPNGRDPERSVTNSQSAWRQPCSVWWEGVEKQEEEKWENEEEKEKEENEYADDVQDEQNHEETREEAPTVSQKEKTRG